MNTFTIGQVADKTGLGIETIRFYERKGLIDEPPRKESGYRQYDYTAIDRLAFIQQAKSLGFTLNEIKELLSLSLTSASPTREIKSIARRRLDDIEDKLKMLKRMRQTLKKLVDACPGEGPASECPILEAMRPKQLPDS